MKFSRYIMPGSALQIRLTEPQVLSVGHLDGFVSQIRNPDKVRHYPAAFISFQTA